MRESPRGQLGRALSRKPSSPEEALLDLVMAYDFAVPRLTQTLFNLCDEAQPLDCFIDSCSIRKRLNGLDGALLIGFRRHIEILPSSQNRRTWRVRQGSHCLAMPKAPLIEPEAWRTQPNREANGASGRA